MNANYENHYKVIKYYDFEHIYIQIKVIEKLNLFL